jgi:hypothetical protein
MTGPGMTKMAGRRILGRTICQLFLGTVSTVRWRTVERVMVRRHLARMNWMGRLKMVPVELCPLQSVNKCLGKFAFVPSFPAKPVGAAKFKAFSRPEDSENIQEPIEIVSSPPTGPLPSRKRPHFGAPPTIAPNLERPLFSRSQRKDRV